jgi:hypothetical protein
MDKQLLAALDNLSIALEMLTESLSKNKEAKSPTATAMQSGNFGEQLKEINKGIQELKDDNKKILDDTQTIIKLQKEKKDSSMNVFEGAGKENNKKMLKDGISVIVLIAGAVLAIGLAFKLIGTVDWKSVLAISVALPMIAFAFEKMAKIKDLTPGKVLMIGLSVVGLSIAIMLSSKVLGLVTPISLFQALTVVFIASAFGAAAFGLGSLLKAFKDIKVADALKASLVLPLVLLAVSVAIAASSVVLQAVQPIGLFQALTAIMIAAAFGVIAYGLGKLISAFKDIDPVTALAAGIVMPIVLVALSMAIVGASWYFQAIVPIGLFQALTAILISATFVILSYAVKPLLQGVKGVSEEDIFKGGVVIVALAAAVTLASWIMMLMAPISLATILKFAALALTLSVSVVLMALAVKVVNKLGSPEDYFDGGLSIVIMATTIMLSSLIISMGNYSVYPSLIWTLFTGLAIAAFALVNWLVRKFGTEKEYFKGGLSVIIIATTIMLVSRILSIGDYKDGSYPGLGWAVGVSLSLVGFGLAALILGVIVSTGVGAVVLLAGAAAIIGIAGTIVAVDAILSAGSYSKYPGLDWAKGVGTSLVIFAAAVVLLGVVNSVGGLASTLTLGFVDNPIDAGIEAVLSISMLIPIVDAIISSGSYKKYPGLEWASGVGLSLTAFTMGVMTVGVIASISDDIIESGTTAIKGIAQSIVDVSFILASGNYKGGPTKDWAQGVSLALGAFSPIYSMLLLNNVMSAFGGGVSVEQFSSAIRTISQGIVDAATFFSNNSAEFKNGPPVSWAEGVGKAISAFSPVYAVLAESSGWFSSGPSVDDMKNAIIAISYGIIDAARIFSENSANFTNGPNKEWVEGVGGSIQAFAPVFQYLSENSGFFGSDIGDLNYAIKSISESIAESSLSLAKGDYTKYPKSEWIDGTIYALQKFKSILKMLNFDDLGSGGIVSSISTLFGGKSPLEQAVSNITLLAMAFEKLGSSMNVFSNSIQDLDVEKLGLVKSMANNVILLSLMDPDMLESVLTKIEEKGGIFAELIKDFEGKKETSPTASPMKVTTAGKDKRTEGQILAEKVDRMTALLADISSVVGSKGALKNYLLSVKDNQLSSSGNSPSTSRSDKRLKNILKKVGQSISGINIYHFTYTFNPRIIYQGVIAQELLNTPFEHALVIDKNGFYSVDYSKLDVQFKKISTSDTF